MLKNKSVIEAKVNDRIYSMECNPESPLGEVHDALLQMKAYVVNRMLEQQKLEEEQSRKPEVEVVEE